MRDVRLLLPFLAAAALLSASGCDDTTGIRSQVDSGITCGANERLLFGECKFVCDRDSDCGAEERCNLFTGVCEAKPAASVDGGALTFPCTFGAVRCSPDNKSVEACTETGSWQGVEMCMGDGYCQNDSCLACQPGLTRCKPDDVSQIQICPDDGSGFMDVTCSNGGTCVQGECRECAPNTTRCSPDGKNVQTCTKTSDPALTWTWKNSGDNFDATCITQQCIPSTPATCKPPDCIPGQVRCGSSSSIQETCSPTGQWNAVMCSALPGMSPYAECQNGLCVDECSEAAKQKSYFGCEYWTAVQDNGVDRFFKEMPLHANLQQGTIDSEFAFVVSNLSDKPTDVDVYRWSGGGEVKLKTVNVPGKTDPTTKGVKVIKVPWQSIGGTNHLYQNQSYPTVSVTGQARFAYRLTSTRPVTVYQFNPLDSARVTKNCNGVLNDPDSSCNELPDYDGPSGIFDPGDPNTWGTCANTTGSKRCHYFTYSNDASLLLPSHILGTSHVAVSQQHATSTTTDIFSGITYTQPLTGHVTIVGTANGTTVTVKSSARTRPSPSNYTPAVAALNPGQTATFTLNRYDVLQLSTDDFGTNIQCAGTLCRRDNDLTGTVITSSAPVAVFGGAACANVPFDKGYCDHLEEQIFPFATWGKTFAAQQSHPLRLTNGNFANASQQAADHYKIVASCPASQCPQGTLITFSTAPASGDVLAPNRCISGTIAGNNCRLAGGSHMEFRSKQNFTITADQPIAVAQFFTGQSATTNSVQGDPSFILLPPVEQWRSEYSVLTAPGIKDNYLGIVYDKTKVTSIEVDGVTVTGFTAVGTTNLMAKNHPVSVGVHTIKAVGTQPSAGVIVYGFDSYVSYGYTGGLDLGSIVSGIDPGG